ncbi:hypothetical protein, partial [uncultured Maritalea sp.]|uniref:hypothetical protein n=1 Tax=uncultured Maritalea sp. TaxID=757249 RepID=UPI0026358AA7
NDECGTFDPAWTQSKTAVRKAFVLCVAIDGLADRYCKEQSVSRKEVLKRVSEFCYYREPRAIREGVIYRIWSIANAHRHGVLDDDRNELLSDKDVLCCATAYGSGVFGVGKYGGLPEVLITTKNGDVFKFLGDSAAVLAGWLRFLKLNYPQYDLIVPNRFVMGE